MESSLTIWSVDDARQQTVSFEVFLALQTEAVVTWYDCYGDVCSNLHIKEDAHLGGLSVPLKVLVLMRGSSTAYGPPSSISTSRNCVSGGRSAAVLPHSGVIHHSLHLAHAR